MKAYGEPPSTNSAWTIEWYDSEPMKCEESQSYAAGAVGSPDLCHDCCRPSMLTRKARALRDALFSKKNARVAYSLRIVAAMSVLACCSGRSAASELSIRTSWPRGLARPVATISNAAERATSSVGCSGTPIYSQRTHHRPSLSLSSRACARIYTLFALTANQPTVR